MGIISSYRILTLKEISGMKKIITLLVGITMMFAFTACSSKNSNADKGSDGLVQDAGDAADDVLDGAKDVVDDVTGSGKNDTNTNSTDKGSNNTESDTNTTTESSNANTNSVTDNKTK